MTDELGVKIQSKLVHRMASLRNNLTSVLQAGGNLT